MPTARPCLAVSSAIMLAIAPSATAAFQMPPGQYRVDWNRAPFGRQYWLVQCPADCPNGNLALVPAPGGNRIVGGPYAHGVELERDRSRLLQAGMPATILAVEVFDENGRRIDGVALGDPAELRRLAGTMAGAQTAGPQPRATSTLCRFRLGPQAGRTVDYAGRPNVTAIAVGRTCADADGSLGVVVAPDRSAR